MSEDGANIGVTPERALGVILGGEDQVNENEHRTSEQMRALLEAKNDDIGGYDAHAEVMAKYFLRLYDKYPQARSHPTKSVYRRDDAGKIIWEGPVLIDGIGEIAKREYENPDHPFRRALSESTGFTFGWAVNAARYAAGLNEVPNPAIVTIST